ncbi:DUF3592 domain-containing protein [Agromyces sp. CFH 90414]|uniref:DUF3592 domain-containing protein n=1 Tax=Agromyces agglutinans TaxID=2662258 RepID=A0A6I2F813_9MICO|nr:DUF3592 domain-containing protein [Agromyces agglutinans]MRG60404.1 DUF3592 domain-containing protein [Agromyces agglutinans]
MRRVRRTPPRPVGTGQVVVWIIAMTVTALLALSAIVAALAMTTGYTEHTTATIVAERVAGGYKRADTCVLTLDYTSDGVAHRVEAPVAWSSCPDRYVVGDVVEMRIDPSRPDMPLVDGAEAHVFGRDLLGVTLVGILPGLMVWTFGLLAFRRRRAERAAAARAAAEAGATAFTR